MVSLRPLIVIPVLVAMAAILACGPSRLTRREAERDLRKDYPVVITVRIPASALATPGSAEHARLEALQTALARAGWFTVLRRPHGLQEQFQFQPTPRAPGALRGSASGFELAAAQAEFVRILPRLETTPDGVRVSYLIRLVRPTEGFPLFQALHPGVRLFETKERHAAYRLEGRAWILQDTDESFKKNP
jgi:hypothetical protein